MSVIFRSRFNHPDARWHLRPTSPSHLSTSSEDCVSYHDDRYVQLRARRGPRTGHIFVPPDIFSFTYGYAEARMRFLSPRGSHSAFWLQTTEDYIPGQAEIDVAEHFGGPAVFHNVYWRPEGALPGEEVGEKRPSKVVDPTGWHVYGCEWRADGYRFTVDELEVARITHPDALSNRPKMLVLSMLVSDFEVANFTDPRQHRTQIDYVKVTD